GGDVAWGSDGVSRRIEEHRRGSASQEKRHEDREEEDRLELHELPPVTANRRAVTSSVAMPVRTRSVWWSITTRPGAVKRTGVEGTVRTIRNKRAAKPMPPMTRRWRAESPLAPVVTAAVGDP